MSDSKDIFRIIDVNINRACEGLRVCEEIIRFYYNDKDRALRLKELRHLISKEIQKLPDAYKMLLVARDSVNDVGNAAIVNVHKKEGINDIFIANIKRAQEALRVLEEFMKMTEFNISGDFQKLRFVLYAIEKDIILALLSDGD